jgi:TetR/AcrR family transcriptional repressor of mexJK operon
MDEIAALSRVLKQTIYKHFMSKEALFVEIVSSMTGHRHGPEGDARAQRHR